MPQMVDEAGNIWEVDAAGNPVSFVGKQGGQGNTVITKRADPNASRKSDLELASIEARLGDMSADNERQDREFEYRRQRDEAEDKRKAMLGSGKPMRQGDADKLAEQVDSYSYLKDAVAGFQDDFAGNKLTGNLENTAQSILGTGTPGQSEWWANFRTADNLIRNSLFGASLTEGEKKAYEDTTVSPSMTPEKVRANLERRAEITRKALARRVGRLRTVFNNEEINAAVGEFEPDFASVLPMDRREAAPQQGNNPMAAVGNIGRPPQGPHGPDMSQVQLGSPSPNQPGGYAPYGATSRTIDNPALAGVNARVNGMLKAGATSQQVSEYLQSAGVDPNDPEIAGGINRIMQFRQENPTYRGDYRVNLDDMIEPMSGIEQFRNSAPQTRIGTAAATAANAGGLGIPQMLAGGEGLDYLRSQNPGSAFAGDVAGIIGGTAALGKVGSAAARRLGGTALLGGGKRAALARQIGTDATYGGIYGATTEGDPLMGAATAALGSAGGTVVGKGLQKTFQGVTDPAVQYLTQRGVPLTMGQTLGNRGIIGKAMNKLESLPVIGDMMGARRLDGMKAFEREALKDVVNPVGGVVTEGGTQGLMQAQDAVGQAYRDALSGVNVSPDPQFMTDAQSAMRAGAAVPKFGEDFTYAMNQEVGPLFGSTGNLAGPELQSALQSIGKIRSGFGKNPDAMAGYAADAAGQMDDALSGLVNRQAPDVMPAYNAAKGAFSRLAPFEKARIGAINQEAISPAQLSRAVTNNTNKFGGRAAASRGDNLTDLMRYGQEVLPSTVPNSGSADRMAGILPFILPTALGGSAAYSGVQDSPGTAGLLATLAAMSTKTGQKALQKALTSRPSAVRKAGGLFGRRKAQRAIGGAITAPLLIQ